MPREIIIDGNDTIRNLSEDYPNLWFTIEKRFPPEHRERILRLVISVCRHCHDEGIGCKCMRDE